MLGTDGGDLVPLASVNDWQPAEGDEPRWAGPFFEMLAGVPDRPWGTARFPIFIVSSNYGIDNLYAQYRHPRDGQLPYILPQRLTALFPATAGVGAERQPFLARLRVIEPRAALRLAAGGRRDGRRGARRVV